MTNVQAGFLGGCILAAGGAIALTLADLDTTGFNDGANLGVILMVVGGCLLLAPLVIARVQKKDAE